MNETRPVINLTGNLAPVTSLGTVSGSLLELEARDVRPGDVVFLGGSCVRRVASVTPDVLTPEGQPSVPVVNMRVGRVDAPASEAHARWSVDASRTVLVIR